MLIGSCFDHILRLQQQTPSAQALVRWEREEGGAREWEVRVGTTEMVHANGFPSIGINFNLFTMQERTDTFIIRFISLAITQCLQFVNTFLN